MKSEMAPQRLALCFTGFIIAIFISACNPPGSNGAPPQRISLTHAENLVRTMIFEQVPDMNPTAQFPLEEITTDGIWEQLKAQIFQIKNDSSFDEDVFLIKNERVTVLAQPLGGRLASFEVTDLDSDGQSELVYTFSGGSGLYRSQLAIYCPNCPENGSFAGNLVYLNGDMTLDKTGEHSVMVNAGYFDLQDRFITEATLGELLLTKDNGKSHFEVRLKNNLPRYITERIKLLSE
jgi:hypothetical protein